MSEDDLHERIKRAEGHAEDARRFFVKERELRHAAERRIAELENEMREYSAEVECQTEEAPQQCKPENPCLACATVLLGRARADLREAVEALRHARVCGPCSQDSWEECEGGRAGEAVLAKHPPGTPPALSPTHAHGTGGEASGGGGGVPGGPAAP